MSSIKKILLMITIVFCINGNNVYASDNVLQAVQITGVNDSYNVVLKSDDVADIKKTVQAPNKLTLLLSGIRASKTINTIYNNTASIDSVVVEPAGDDKVRVLIQGANVGTAQVQFDSLKTPLGLLGKNNNQPQNNSNGEITLNGPMTSFRPIYDENSDEDTDNSSILSSFAEGAQYAKKALSNDKTNWMITFGLFTILILSGMKIIKGKDNEIKIGLSQSLQEREIDLYRNSGMANLQNPTPSLTSPNTIQPNYALNQQRSMTSSAYGLKSYQNGTKSPYATPESRPVMMQKPTQTASIARKTIASEQARQPIQNMMQNTITKPVRPTAAAKSTNIDSMKFLESMTKIYEKNGRSDLAQGLKSNIKKAQTGARA